jgi:hypothetical protein
MPATITAVIRSSEVSILIFPWMRALWHSMACAQSGDAHSTTLAQLGSPRRIFARSSTATGIPTVSGSVSRPAFQVLPVCPLHLPRGQTS